MIKKYSLLVLQTAINHALSLDEAMPMKLRPLHNKILEIIISPLNVNFFMSFSDAGLCLLAEHHDPADAIIQSSPLGLIRLSLLPVSKVRSLFNDEVQISGDIELGQQVKKLFDTIDIDWESHLARFTGDVMAYQLGSFVRKGLAFKRHVAESLHHNVTEYLQEELRAFPPREEVEDFFNDVDELALRVERLSARINPLREGSL
jgi:ubiquinone biosynthesis protein UbiJ